MLEFRGKLQNAATTGNGTAVDLKGQCSSVLFYITGAADVTSGAVTLETAPTTDYAGTWQPIGSAITVGDDTTQAVSVQGVPYLAVRARISTTVAGGAAPSVTVELVAHSDTGA